MMMMCNTCDSLIREVERLREEVERLNAAKTIVLGRAKVLVASAHELGADKENEVLLVDAAGRKACIGELSSELVGTVMENANPRLLARLVVAHPDGASVLIAQLEAATDASSSDSFEDVQRVEALKKEPPIPCQGYWTYMTDGLDFSCGYEPDFVCDDCIVNGGLRDPRVQSEDE